MTSENIEYSEEEYNRLLDTTTHKLHDVLVEFINLLSMQLDDKGVDEIMINALAINLGNIIGQLDVDSQQKYSALSRSIIREYTLLGTMNKDVLDYGQIGSA